MSPKKSGTATKAEGSTAEGGINVTAGDTKIIMSVLRASTAASKPWIAGSVRWDQVSQELGFKNAKVAKDRISQVRSFPFDAIFAVPFPRSRAYFSSHNNGPFKRLLFSF